jgi:hypothetical protein
LAGEDEAHASYFFQKAREKKEYLVFVKKKFRERNVLIK